MGSMGKARGKGVRGVPEFQGINYWDPVSEAMQRLISKDNACNTLLSALSLYILQPIQFGLFRSKGFHSFHAYILLECVVKKDIHVDNVLEIP